MSRIRADKFVNSGATGAPQLTFGAEVPVGYGITGAGGINITGVATAASFSGAGDTNTAIRFPAADTFTVETAGSERLRVDSGGKVGIGTTNPGTKLDVRGGNWANGDIVVGQSGNAGRVKFRRGVDGSDSGSIGFSAADNNSVLSMNVASGDGTLTFQTNSAERLRITSAGRFGFNTNSPDYTVDINGELGITEGQPVTWHDGSGNPAAQIYGDSSSNLIFRTGVSGMGERMRLLPAGGLTFNGDTATANALDDYEEGTWTPSIGGNASYTTQTGTYTKVGRLVYVNCNIQINVIGTGSVTTITGLPFTSSGGLADSSAVGYWTSGSRNVTTLMACTNSTQVVFTDTASAASGTTLNGGIFQNSTNLRFGLCYQV